MVFKEPVCTINSMGRASLIVVPILAVIFTKPIL